MSPLTRQISRQDLLDVIRRTERTSSFERLLSTTIYDEVRHTTATAQTAVEATRPEQSRTTATSKDRTVAGWTTGSTRRFSPNGLYFSVSLDFALAEQGANRPLPALTADEKANWGTGFGNPLVNPKMNCIYVVRAKIEQLRVDPMIGGFRLQWVPPPGWVRVDRHAATVYVEASSNPLIVARKYRSPNVKSKNVVFRVRVLAWYP